mmetsp:Transcript_11804/g.21498  ORF Transcript_11804/g.21498 Transcript_11804/m.21498 type:complete len:107 (+) Transcript_11804:434-754(+)
MPYTTSRSRVGKYPLYILGGFEDVVRTVLAIGSISVQKMKPLNIPLQWLVVSNQCGTGTDSKTAKMNSKTGYFIKLVGRIIQKYMTVSCQARRFAAAIGPHRCEAM